MTILEIVLVLTALLSALVAGLVFTFAVVVMPGLRRLPDRDFLRGFAVIDKVIQDSDPLFVLVWVGSVLAVLAALVLGLATLGGLDRWIAVAAAIVFLVGVQAPTLLINVPLNNRVQALDLDTLDPAGLEAARRSFEPTWNRWNRLRTVFACVSVMLWLTLLVRL